MSGVFMGMGKEISYCHSCGNRLLENESGDSRAYLHDGRRFCAACCPAGSIPKVSPPERRRSSTKLKAQAPAVRRESTRIRKRSGLRLALSAAAVVALGVGIAIAAGGAPADPQPSHPAPVPMASPAPAESKPLPKADPSSSLDEVLGKIREIRQSDLMFERRDEVRKLIAEASGLAGSRLEEVDLLAAEYERKFQDAAARLADFTRSEAQRMATKQKYAEAIERLDGFPAAFQGSRAAESLRLLRQDLERRRAESAVQSPAPSNPPRRVISYPEWH